MKINDAERQVSTGDFKLKSLLIFFFLFPTIVTVLDTVNMCVATWQV